MVETQVPQKSISLLKSILARFSNELGPDHSAYLNHCLRVLNLALKLTPVPLDDIQSDQLTLAVAFHDLGIWTNKTFDYLDASIQILKAYLIETNRTEWFDELAAVILNHHKITAASNSSTSLVELVRKADWIDVSLGLLTFGVSSKNIREIQNNFPNLGFHKRLVQLTLRQFSKDPLRPLPMLRW